MSIAYDTSVSNSANFQSTLTIAMTIASLSNRVLLSFASNESSNSTFPTAATWNGVAMNAGTVIVSTIGGFRSRSFWQFGDGNVATGLHNELITWSDGLGKPRGILAAYDGVGAVSAETTFSLGVTTLTPSFTVATAVGDTVVLFTISDNAGNAVTGTSGTTVRSDTVVGGKRYVIAEKLATSTSTTLNLSTAAPAPSWNGVAYALTPSAGGASIIPAFGLETLTGFAPTVSQTGVAVGNGTETLTGFAPTIARTTFTGGVITTDPLKNNTATVQAGLTGLIAHVYSVAGGFIVSKSALSTDSVTGRITFSDTLLVPGTTYIIMLISTTTGACGVTKLAAA